MTSKTTNGVVVDRPNAWSPITSAATIIVFGLLGATSTGAAAVSQTQIIIGHEQRTSVFRAANLTQERSGTQGSSAALLRDLRDQSGLTWDQIARLFGVSRRAVHHWAAGDSMNAHNHELLSKLFAVVAGLSGTTPSEKRDELMRPNEHGTSAYDALRRAITVDGVDINALPVSLSALLGVEVA